MSEIRPEGTPPGEPFFVDVLLTQLDVFPYIMETRCVGAARQFDVMQSPHARRHIESKIHRKAEAARRSRSAGLYIAEAASGLNL